MKLSKRLEALCDLVPNGSNIIDVGADHALTSIYLNKNKNCRVLATDISEKCLTKAKENIKKHNATVDLLVTDGLNKIKLDKQIIIISGMGTHTILKILDKKLTNDLIISSNNDIPLLKKQLHKKGYHIYDEKVIYDKHYYVITYYKYGKNKMDYYISSYYTKDYLKCLLKNYSLKYKYEKSIYRKFEYKNLIKKIKKAIHKN
ncbi:MAG: SAM-dependent methyltransferase [Bacilli bacterium]|nr:SAM-dependent methyltransferase [Bacilli bacterium]